MPILPPIDTSPQPAKVITLKEVRGRYRPGACAHRHLIVDVELSEVECEDCGAKLNPVAMLARFAHEESMWEHRLTELRKHLKALEEKERCKCKHCGRFTPVRP